MGKGLTWSRRHFLGAAAAAVGELALGSSAGRTLRAAAAACPAPGGLSAVEHVIIVIQENRAFDHYFGSYRGVRGFADPAVLRQPGGLDVFAQPGYPEGRNPDGHLLPFHLDSRHGNGECVGDVTHNWGPQHRCWAGGRMDGWVTTHLAEDGRNGTNTMGYYTRADLAFYYALADAFTICDAYFCSALGPTDPNRLYALSATIDPEGRAGGPVVQSAGTPGTPPALSWTTMPEQLQARGISWKVYASPDSTWVDGDNTLLFFKQYYTSPALAENAFTSTFPGTFMTDVAAGTLPQVSWIISPVAQLEHPPGPPDYGEHAISQLLATLTQNPQIWAKTVVFITWDENGGLFDHVAPPTPPPGTAGERLATVSLPSQAQGIREPIGPGFRVPLLVVSPFSRGGLVCSDVFDHTSLLRFLETRFGAEVPNLSAWRRATVGDLTSALDPGSRDTSVPRLPETTLADPVVLRECVPGALTGQVGLASAYPVPPNSMPSQEPDEPRRRAPCAASGNKSAPPLFAGPAGLPNTGYEAWPSGIASLLLAGCAAVVLRRRRRVGESGES